MVGMLGLLGLPDVPWGDPPDVLCGEPAVPWGDPPDVLCGEPEVPGGKGVLGLKAVVVVRGDVRGSVGSRLTFGTF